MATQLGQVYWESLFKVSHRDGASTATFSASNNTSVDETRKYLPIYATSYSGEDVPIQLAFLGRSA